MRKPLNIDRRYDLCICFEVGEHLQKKYSTILVKNLISTSDRIIFSSAIPGQGGEYHINEQPCQYWIDLFRKENYLYKERETADIKDEMRKRNVIWYIPQNIMFFERA